MYQLPRQPLDERARENSVNVKILHTNCDSPSRIATLPVGMNIAHMVKKASQQLTTVPVSVSTAAASGASGVGGAVSGATGTKENLYVIALPPDQLRYLKTL